MESHIPPQSGLLGDFEFTTQGENSEVLRVHVWLLSSRLG